MKVTIFVASIALLLSGSGVSAEDPAKPIDVAVAPTMVDPPKRSIMLYLRDSEGYPLRDEPIIITERQIPQYRAGIRACDTLMQICRPREDGSFLNPGTSEEQKRYCGPLEPASPATCTLPSRGSFQ